MTDKDNKVIGNVATFRDNTPNGAFVNTDQQIADYESIVLAPDVAVNNILPGWTRPAVGSGAGRDTRRARSAISA